VETDSEGQTHTHVCNVTGSGTSAPGEVIDWKSPRSCGLIGIQITASRLEEKRRVFFSSKEDFIALNAGKKIIITTTLCWFQTRYAFDTFCCCVLDL